MLKGPLMFVDPSRSSQNTSKDHLRPKNGSFHANFSGRIGGSERRKVEEEVYKNPSNYSVNRMGNMLMYTATLVNMSLILLIAYNGGFHSVKAIEDFENVQVWRRIWASSVPLWSVLISNFGILAITLLVSQSKLLFLRFPRKPLVLVIIATMCASSFVFFLHPIDAVFYPGMALIAVDNYLWLLMMVKANDFLALLIHPYLHNCHERSWFGSSKKRASENDKVPDESTKILKSCRVIEDV